MISIIKDNEEVYYSDRDVTKINQSDIRFLKEKAINNKRKRVRLCTHPGVDETLHEMLIIHHKGNYIPPHKHIGKSESFHIVEGRLNVVIFYDNGRIREVVTMNNRDSREYFYCRLSKSYYHTIVPLSEVVVFNETTNGPFRRQEMLFAEWAPTEDATYEEQLKYVTELKKRILKFSNKLQAFEKKPNNL